MKRKERTPEEILIFCIDSSSSMNDPCDFTELNEVDDEVHDGNIDDYDEWEDDDQYYDDWEDDDQIDCEDEDGDEGDGDDEMIQSSLPDDDQDTLRDEEVSGLTLSETKRTSKPLGEA